MSLETLLHREQRQETQLGKDTHALLNEMGYPITPEALEGASKVVIEKGIVVIHYDGCSWGKHRLMEFRRQPDPGISA